MYEAVVIADDFTGANDTGIQLKKYGFDTVVLIDLSKIRDAKRWDAVVIDTESRGMPKERAYETLLNVSRMINKMEPAIVYKKVDSTLRGNLSMEIKAICDNVKIDIIAFAPAYPQMGRTTIDGIHLLNGIPINKTELSKDPKNPIKNADLKEVLIEDLDITCMNVNLKDLRGNFLGMIKYISLPCAFIFDVEIYEDLKTISQMINIFPGKRILWVGSAGLANALFENCKKPQKPVLSLVGSVNSVSIEQYKYVINHHEAYAVVIDVISLLENERREIDRIMKVINSYLDDGKDVVIATVDSRADYEKTIQWSLDHHLEMRVIGEKIARTLGSLVCQIIEKHKLSGLFVTGGDIAISVIKAIGADGSVVVDEIETGVPLLKIYGGPYDGTNLVTKAGGFGNIETISHAIKRLKALSI